MIYITTNYGFDDRVLQGRDYFGVWREEESGEEGGLLPPLPAEVPPGHRGGLLPAEVPAGHWGGPGPALPL